MSMRFKLNERHQFYRSIEALDTGVPADYLTYSHSVVAVP